MAVSGFEGFEKRVELRFSDHDPVAGKGLRRLDFFLLEKVLHEVQCTVVSAVGNHHFDSYVLSESSLFVYPTKIIIKTCGTTQLLKSVRPLVDHAAAMGLTLSGCRYTRGSFIFPDAQPFPHTSFKEEVSFLEKDLPENLSVKKAAVMGSESSYKWHVFTACDEGLIVDPHADDYATGGAEFCMTELDLISVGQEKTDRGCNLQSTSKTHKNKSQPNRTDSLASEDVILTSVEPPPFGTTHVIQEVYGEAGILGFWRGVLPTLIMVSNPSIQFMLYETLLKKLKKRRLSSSKGNNDVTALEIFLLGALAKLGATVVTYPLLVVKSRLQAKQVHVDKRQQYRGTLDAIVKMIRYEGFYGFYKGMSTKIVQSVLAAAVLFMVKEELVKGTRWLLTRGVVAPMKPKP